MARTLADNIMGTGIDAATANEISEAIKTGGGTQGQPGGTPGPLSDPGGTLPASQIPFGDPGDAAGPLNAQGQVPLSQIPIDGLNYQGAWDASTNTPALADGSGTAGDFYRVSAAGSQDLGSGSLNFAENDHVIFEGGIWQKFSGANSVLVGGNTTAGALEFGTTGAQGVHIQTNGNNRIVIDSIGNVGIGVDSPSAPLAIAGAFTVVAGSVGTEWNPTSGSDLTLGTTSNDPIHVITNGTTQLTVATDGQLTAGASYVPSAAKSLAPKDYVDSAVAAIPANPTAANPSAIIGLTAKNGTNPDYMRSDGAPALDQSIAPTWTGEHTFSNHTRFTAGSTTNRSTLEVWGNSPSIDLFWQASPTPDEGRWYTCSGINSLIHQTLSDDGTQDQQYQILTRSGINVTKQEFLTTGAARFTISDTDLAAGTGYVPANPLSLATKGYIDTASALLGGNGTTAAMQIGTTTAQNLDLLYNNAVTVTVGPDGIAIDNNVVNGKLVLFGGLGVDHEFYGFGINSHVLRYQVDGTDSDHVFYAAASGTASNELLRVKGTGEILTQGPVDILHDVVGNKLRLGQKLPGTTGDAPTDIGNAYYLGVGAGEWTRDSYRLIGLGYIAAAANHYPAFVGYQEMSISSNTSGDLIFGTRGVNTNTAADIRLRITAAGDIKAEDAAYAPASPESLTDKKYVDGRLSAAQRTAIDALTAIATADATDTATTMALVNECKATLNGIVNALQAT